MKNLIYYSFNSDYVDLFKLHMSSLDKFKDGSFDCMTITEKPVGGLDFHYARSQTAFQSSANKLKIYQYKKLSYYNKVLYCDVDTIWNKSPNELFEAITEDKIYISNEQQLMSHPAGYWGEYLMNDEQRKDIAEKNILGINCGVFGFKYNICNVFKDIENYMGQNKEVHNALYEQPFMNVYLYEKDLINNSLNDFVENSYDGTGSKHLIHFLGGDKEAKLSKMKNYDYGK